MGDDRCAAEVESIAQREGWPEDECAQLVYGRMRGFDQGGTLAGRMKDTTTPAGSRLLLIFYAGGSSGDGETQGISMVNLA